MAEIKKGDFVRVTGGKFVGWRGTVWKSEKEGKYTYFDLFPRYRQTRKGRIEATTVGLGVILNVERKKLKKVI